MSAPASSRSFVDSRSPSRAAKNQRRQTAATAADEAGDDDVGIIFLRRSSAGGSVSCAALCPAACASTALSASTLSTTALTAAALCGLRALQLSGSRRPGSRRSSRRRPCGTALLLLVAAEPAEGVPAGAAHASHTAVGDVDGKLFFVGLPLSAAALTNLDGCFDARRRSRDWPCSFAAVPRRRTSLRSRLAVEQRLDGFRMLLFDRPHQRRRAAKRFSGVDLGAGRDQNA